MKPPSLPPFPIHTHNRHESGVASPDDEDGLPVPGHLLHLHRQPREKKHERVAELDKLEIDLLFQRRVLRIGAGITWSLRVTLPLACGHVTLTHVDMSH